MKGKRTEEIEIDEVETEHGRVHDSGFSTVFENEITRVLIGDGRITVCIGGDKELVVSVQFDNKEGIVDNRKARVNIDAPMGHIPIEAYFSPWCGRYQILDLDWNADGKWKEFNSDEDLMESD